MCREREVIESSFRTQMKMYFFVAVKVSDDFKYFVANNVFFVELQKIYSLDGGRDDVIGGKKCH